MSSNPSNANDTGYIRPSVASTVSRRPSNVAGPSVAAYQQRGPVKAGLGFSANVVQEVNEEIFYNIGINNLDAARIDAQVPKVSYLDTSTAFEKASKKFRKTKAPKLLPQIKHSSPKISPILKNKHLKIHKKQSHVQKSKSNLGITQPFQIVMDADTINLKATVLQGASDVLPPIRQQAKGFHVAKASTGRLIDKANGKSDLNPTESLFNVFLIGKPVGYNPIDLKRVEEGKKKNIFRDWVADADTPSLVSEETEQLEPYFARESIFELNQVIPAIASVSKASPKPESVHEEMGSEVQYFNGIDEIEEMTHKYG